MVLTMLRAHFLKPSFKRPEVLSMMLGQWSVKKLHPKEHSVCVLSSKGREG